jgi:hypothetical protein
VAGRQAAGDDLLLQFLVRLFGERQSSQRNHRLTLASGSAHRQDRK